MGKSRKYRYPASPPAGSESFSPDLVGFQLVDGGGLTQGNFEFTTSIVEKVNRTFSTGVFSNPFTLENMDMDSFEESRKIIARNYGVYPNYDISVVTNFSLYGSLQKRLSASVTKIINFFPAALEVDRVYTDFTTANTVYNVSYDAVDNETTFNIDVSRIKNPLDIDYSTMADRNMSLRPMEVSPYRNLTRLFLRYSLFIGTGETEYKLQDFTPSPSLSAGTIEVVVNGNPYSGASSSTENITLRPNKFYTEQIFDDSFDEIEKFLLNRLIKPKYTAMFRVPRETEQGKYYTSVENITWPVLGLWNVDVQTVGYENYLNRLSEIGEVMDRYKTNLISRFLVTGAFKDFDTGDQKMEKVLQIYGRSFDETKKFIDGLTYMNNVNYNPKNDIPSVLLQNLAQTLGFDTNNSPISQDDFLTTVFGTKNQSIYPGQTRDKTPQELDYEYYRKIIINSGFLYKSKGTRTAIEFLMRMVGAPKALVEFNETVYVADGPINIKQFDQQFIEITGGTKLNILPVLTPQSTYKVKGVTYTAFTPQSFTTFVDDDRTNYPMDYQGYPQAVPESDSYFFEMGSGWFEETPKHRANEKIDIQNSNFTGQNTNIQTSLETYTFGEKYFNLYRDFPSMDLGYTLTPIKDNLKSWPSDSTGLRKSNGVFNSYYNVTDDRLVLNRKNIELYLNMGQGLEYDVWEMSRNTGYPIPATGLTYPYPTVGGIDWTVINPRPKEKSFFEFAETFYKNMINVRNRQTSSGGYVTLSSLYWKYLTSEVDVNIPSNQYTYQKMIDFTNGIGDYWMRLVEQVVPASTLWLGGQKMENSEFHRQKHNYKLQRGCDIVDIDCEPCEIEGPLWKYDCAKQIVECDFYPTSTFQNILNQQVNTIVSSSGYTTNQCDLNSVVSDWYIDLRLNGNILVQQQFFTGNGFSSSPTNNDWLNAAITYFQYLYQYGLSYTISGNTITFTNIGCDPNFTNKTITLNVGINISINCG